MSKSILLSASDLRNHLQTLNPDKEFLVTSESNLLMIRSDQEIIHPSVYDGLPVLIGPTDGLKVN